MNAVMLCALCFCPPPGGSSIHLSVIRPVIELSVTRPVTYNRIAYIEVVPPATTAPPVYDVAPPMPSSTAPPVPAADVAPAQPAPAVRYYPRYYSAAPARSVIRLDVGVAAGLRSGYHARRAAVNARKAVRYTEKAAWHASRS